MIWHIYIYIVYREFKDVVFVHGAFVHCTICALYRSSRIVRLCIVPFVHCTVYREFKDVVFDTNSCVTIDGDKLY